ncbi:Uncaracterized surface protein containing fasciclin (FAS1) repeats [Bizionia echini]|uniref:Uncaracterized surface protein containing fasciclin (FAS1) repeats n=1 Tax=Bizionia echini TaxID=649333 RepID=A0A1I5DC28_9FLAO|nr:fasciclin domain-containing protein [Bizionia echini]SFN96763.1 Uncaracterized surface protein containing fasciclin (FAS1) repeats [Bizionia echini]
MKTLTALKRFSASLLAVFLIASCSSDDDNNPITPTPQQNNIVDLALANPELSSLVAALQAADGDLVSVLQGSGPFTVLAPDNDAFAAFLSDNGFASLDDVPTDVLSQVLLNHVISGSVPSTALVSQGSGYASTNATGAGGASMSLYFNTANNDVRFNNVASVSTADVAASNGIIHIVDGVIGLPDVVDHALANSSFSNLVAALGAADGDLVSVLQGNGPYTVLAPVDMAFSDFLADNGFSGLGDVPTDVLSQVLLNHVLAGATFSTDLVNMGSGYTTTSATGAGDNAMSLYFNTSDGVTFNGISSVAEADVVGTNGVIHAVDAVIGLPTVVDFALADPTFETLVAALTRDDLTFDYVGTLSTPNGTAPAPFTVFAPTNDAFGDLLTELNVASLGDIPEATLKATLDMHAVAGANVRSTALMDNMTVSTLGGDITANITGGATLTDANGRVSNIIAVDVQASNGVIHAIDKVVLPPL